MKLRKIFLASVCPGNRAVDITGVQNRVKFPLDLASEVLERLNPNNDLANAIKKVVRRG